MSLRRYSQTKTIELRTLFAFGFFAGFAFIFVMIILFLRYEGYLDPKKDQIFNEVFPCFRYCNISLGRGLALFLMYYWCIALDVWGWNFFRINYKIYLGFNHHFSTLIEILSRVSVLSSVFLFMFVIYCLQEQKIGRLTNSIMVIHCNHIIVSRSNLHTPLHLDRMHHICLHTHQTIDEW